MREIAERVCQSLTKSARSKATKSADASDGNGVAEEAAGRSTVEEAKALYDGTFAAECKERVRAQLEESQHFGDDFRRSIDTLGPFPHNRGDTLFSKIHQLFHGQEDVERMRKGREAMRSKILQTAGDPHFELLNDWLSTAPEAAWRKELEGDAFKGEVNKYIASLFKDPKRKLAVLIAFSMGELTCERMADRLRLLLDASDRQMEKDRTALRAAEQDYDILQRQCNTALQALTDKLSAERDAERKVLEARVEELEQEVAAAKASAAAAAAADAKKSANDKKRPSASADEGSDAPGTPKKQKMPTPPKAGLKPAGKKSEDAHYMDETKSPAPAAPAKAKPAPAQDDENFLDF